jgi:hypothetical protein
MSMTINPGTFITPEADHEPGPMVLPWLTHVSRIYCGRSIPKHRAHNDQSALVRDASVAAFVEKVLAVMFPDGFTLLHGEGGWRDQTHGAPVREKSLVIEIMHGPDKEDVLAVAKEWKRWFAQDAVMVSTSEASVAFV